MNKLKINKVTSIVILTIFLFTLLSAQKRERSNLIPQKRPIYFESHIFPVDSSYICNFSYKISYNNLVFVKDNSHYSSGYSLTFEIFENEQFVKRIIGNGAVKAQNYVNTISKNLYHEGFISFEIKKGNFQVKPLLLLNNTDIEVNLEPIQIIVDSTQIYKPLFVREIKSLRDSSRYQLVNFQNSVPFSENKFDMLIPTYSNTEKPIALEILQNGKIISTNEVSEYVELNRNFHEYKGRIVLTYLSNLPLIKFYKLNFINQKLVEGEFEINIKLKNENINFKTPVLWFDKPKSLKNIEQAIEYLETIGLKNSADSLLDIPEEEQYQALFNFWKKFDEDSSTSFNPVLDEFYSRIDFVRNEYNSLGKSDGVDTDRGRTYIVYGKPDSIERTFNDVYDVIEVWEYKNNNKKIYFSDKTGTGKFERIK